VVNPAARAAPEAAAAVVEVAAVAAPVKVELALVQGSEPHWVMVSALARESAV
jgi:hypothetical protein